MRCVGRGAGLWLPAFALECTLALRFLSGLGHNRCWFGLALVLCRHLPISQSPRVWHSLQWLAEPSQAESSPGTAGVAGALARGGGEHTQALPTQCLAMLSNTVPSLKYLGLAGLSLQLKLKHESSPGCLPLCCSWAWTVPEHIMRRGAVFQGSVLSGVCFFQLCILLVAAAKCTWEASFCLPTESHLWDGGESHFPHVHRYACYPASRSDLSLARTYKIVSLADCQKLHHIGVNCF